MTAGDKVGAVRVLIVVVIVIVQRMIFLEAAAVDAEARSDGQGRPYENFALEMIGIIGVHIDHFHRLIECGVRRVRFFMSGEHSLHPTVANVVELLHGFLRASNQRDENVSVALAGDERRLGAEQRGIVRLQERYLH